MATGKAGPKRETTKERRLEQLQQIQQIIASLEEPVTRQKDERKQITLLESVSQGLYDEVDKLTKKYPGEPATDLVVSQVNDVIKETKQLALDDPYVQRLKEFVPAGDNPQQRDVIVVLQQIKRGLERFKEQLDSQRNQQNESICEAKFLVQILQLYLEGETKIQRDELIFHSGKVYNKWFCLSHPHAFNFARLDNIDISDYFAKR